MDEYSSSKVRLMARYFSKTDEILMDKFSSKTVYVSVNWNLFQFVDEFSRIFQ